MTADPGSMQKCWIYVSESTSSDSVRTADVEAIVEGSILRNDSLGVTGALLLCQGRFAQLLEGGRESLEVLQRSILADPRHRLVTTLADISIDRRAFGDWSLAYSGQSEFFAAILNDFALGGAQAGSAAAAEKVLQLFAEFARSLPQKSTW